MSSPATDFAASRRFMIDGQLRPNDVTEPRLLRAFYDVPRELFVPSSLRSTAYAERAVPLGNGRHLLEPMVLAKLLQTAAIGQNDHVLIVGSATGYGAALVGHLASSVIGLECEADLVQEASEAVSEIGIGNVRFVHGHLTEGYASAAPYDVIVLEGAAYLPPGQFVHQLKEDGRLVAVVGGGGAARGMVYNRTAQGLSGRPLFETSAAILPGFERKADFVF
jgi:protein-L-isoaspartate(D-aspartate) O-methyltransferase